MADSGEKLNGLDALLPAYAEAWPEERDVVAHFHDPRGLRVG